MNVKPKQPKALWTRVKGSGWSPKKRVVRFVPKESAAGADRRRRYNRVAKMYLKENQFCVVHADGCMATQVHHSKGRLGSLLFDTTYFLPVCDEAHLKIHANPAWAYQMGYLLNRG